MISCRWDKTSSSWKQVSGEKSKLISASKLSPSTQAAREL